MPIQVPAFLLTCLLLAMVPGAGQALMLRQTLTLGRAAAFLTAAGTALGILVWSVTAAAGLSAVLLANPTAYGLLRIAGGVVLAGLGLSSLRTMRRERAGGHRPVPAATASRNALVAGLTTNLANPKAGVFAISFLPQFIRPSGWAFLSAVLLGGLWALTTGAWYALFILSVHRGRSLMSRPGVSSWMHGITGTVLVALGVAVTLGA